MQMAVSFRRVDFEARCCDVEEQRGAELSEKKTIPEA
jgi:hypothetical protein